MTTPNLLQEEKWGHFSSRDTPKKVDVAPDLMQSDSSLTARGVTCVRVRITFIAEMWVEAG